MATVGEIKGAPPVLVGFVQETLSIKILGDTLTIGAPGFPAAILIVKFFEVASLNSVSESAVDPGLVMVIKHPLPTRTMCITPEDPTVMAEQPDSA